MSLKDTTAHTAQAQAELSDRYSIERANISDAAGAEFQLTFL